MNKLHKAVIQNDIGEIENILRKFPNIIDEKDHENGFTPLHIAAAKGYKKIIKLLFQNDANPLLPDKQGNRPDSIALKEGHKDLAELINKLQIKWIDNLVEIDFNLGEYMDLNEAIEIGYYDDWTEQEIEKYLGTKFLPKFKERKKL